MDEIQKVLVEQGRKDLAQKYYVKTASYGQIRECYPDEPISEKTYASTTRFGKQGAMVSIPRTFYGLMLPMAKYVLTKIIREDAPMIATGSDHTKSVGLTDVPVDVDKTAAVINTLTAIYPTKIINAYQKYDEFHVVCNAATREEAKEWQDNFERRLLTDNQYRGKNLYAESSNLFFAEIPETNWDDVVLNDKTKKDIRLNTVSFLGDEKLAKAGVTKRGLMMYGPPGTGKCVIGSTLILTENGMIPIEKIYEGEIGYNDFEINVLSKDGLAKTSHWYKELVNKTIKIKTKMGYELEGTEDHPIRIFSKEDKKIIWKKLKDVVEDDYIAIERSNNLWPNCLNFLLDGFNPHITNRTHEYELPKIMTKDLAKLLGYLVAEGHCHKDDKTTITFSNNDDVILCDFKKCFKSLFNIELEIKNDRTCKKININSSLISQFLRHIGLVWGVSKFKEIPWSILESPKEYVVEYLRAYFEGDGGMDNRDNIECSTASEVMGRQLQILLANFGIISKRRSKFGRATNGKKIYRKYNVLTIYGKNVDLFFDNIGFISDRKNNSYIGRNRNTNIDVIPDFSDEFINNYSNNGYCKTANGLSKVKLRINYKNNITYDVLENNLWIIDSFREIGEEISANTLVELNDKKYFWDTIDDKREVFAEKMVYDLTVPNKESFIANSIVNHNTSVCKAVFRELEGKNVSRIYVTAESFRRMAMNNLFDIIKYLGKTVLAFEDIDMVGTSRDATLGNNLLGDMLTNLDGMRKYGEQLVVMASTNKLNLLDEALSNRPCRFDRKIEIGLPDDNNLRRIYMKHTGNEVQDDVIKLSKDFTGSHVVEAVNTAKILAASESKQLGDCLVEACNIIRENFFPGQDVTQLKAAVQAHMIKKGFKIVKNASKSSVSKIADSILENL